jgi:predicted RNA-binding Zn-ribbon protein involved in translation (DUF1610 family)
MEKRTEQCPGCGRDVVIKTARHSGLCPKCAKVAGRERRARSLAAAIAAAAKPAPAPSYPDEPFYRGL